jgi:eukaryotic-like serine/threonine-protein kinase
MERYRFLAVNAGSHIGQYRILRKLGAGGMGTVYLAEHILLGRQAAIKTLLPTLSIHPEIVERFFNEARATSAIADPGVVQVFDFGYHVDGTAYIVMELLEGEALSDRMDRLGALPQVDALKIARQIACALEAAHKHGIVHRDLKPENIYLVHDGEAQGGERTKILDFGICKLEGDEGLTQSGTTLGTPVYMSPEQCRGSGGVDQRSDIYALGCVLFHMLTARTPFECEGVGEYIVAHLQQEPPSASSLVPGLHALVDVLLIRCLAKDPGERFQSMHELQEAIGQIMSKLSSPGLAPAIPAGSPVLSQGFRSDNEVEVGARAKVSASGGEWFIEDATPGTTTGSLAGEPTAPPLKMSRLRRTALAAIMLGAVITGVFATRAALGTEDANASPEVPPMASQTASAPVEQPTVAAVPEAVPAPEVVPALPPTAEPVAEPAVEAAPVAPVAEKAVEPKQVAKRTIIKQRPVRKTARASTNRPARRAVTAPSVREPEEAAPPPPKPTTALPTPPAEDLYDTR